SPLRAESLKGLPPAYVITAEYDVLRDEGEVYAQRLKDEGNDVVLERFDGMVHGFVRRTHDIDRSFDAIQRISEEIARALA
ncbi:MAG: alpha/beta hydrolase fold domain-containing protein, partial [Planctomycetota bacterium]